MGIFSFLIFGLVIGAIARFLMPGPQPMGLILTCILGVAGSYVGGYLGALIHGGQLDAAQPASWIGSIIGALLLLLAYGMFRKRQA